MIKSHMNSQHIEMVKKPLPNQQTYYSKTQSNFFRAYAQTSDFLLRLSQLLNSIQKRKISKLLQQVKSTNKTFKRYINQKRISNIKIQDVIQFEDININNNDRQSRMSNLMFTDQFKRSNLIQFMQSVNGGKNTFNKSFGNSKNIMYISLQSRQMIKKGFMSFLEKLQNQHKEEFINKTKYLESIIERQCHKLTNYGYDYREKGVKGIDRNFKNNLTVIEQLEKQEITYGLYPIIMKNIRDQTNALEKVIINFQTLMKE